MSVESEFFESKRHRTDGNRHHLKSSFHRIWAWFAASYFEWKTRQVDRATIRELLDASDHSLRDIGLTRDDVKRASRLPGNQSATLELQRIARSSRDMKSVF